MISSKAVKLNLNSHLLNIVLRWRIICPGDCGCRDPTNWRLDQKIKDLDRRIFEQALTNESKALQTAKTLLKLYDPVQVEPIKDYLLFCERSFLLTCFKVLMLSSLYIRGFWISSLQYDAWLWDSSQKLVNLFNQLLIDQLRFAVLTIIQPLAGQVYEFHAEAKDAVRCIPDLRHEKIDFARKHRVHPRSSTDYVLCSFPEFNSCQRI